jgi:ATP-dependent Clp protease protease subunit
MRKKSAIKSRLSVTAVEMMKHKHSMLLDYCLDIEHRIITLSGEVEDGWFDYLDTRITLLEKQSNDPITLRLNSPGGATYEAMAVVGRIKSSACKFIIEGYGCIMSAATLILACGHHRKLSRYSWVMHHGSYWGVDPTRNAEVREMAKQNEREEVLWNEWMATFTGRDVAFWQKWSGHKDLYLTAEQALQHGIVDELI